MKAIVKMALAQIILTAETDQEDVILDDLAEYCKALRVPRAAAVVALASGSHSSFTVNLGRRSSP